MTQPQPEREEDFETWRDLQEVLEERDREWWAEETASEEAGEG